MSPRRCFLLKQSRLQLFAGLEPHSDDGYKKLPICGGKSQELIARWDNRSQPSVTT
jgi:hypothetical protein